MNAKGRVPSRYDYVRTDRFEAQGGLCLEPPHKAHPLTHRGDVPKFPYAPPRSRRTGHRAGYTSNVEARAQMMVCFESDATSAPATHHHTMLYKRPGTPLSDRTSRARSTLLRDAVASVNPRARGECDSATIINGPPRRGPPPLPTVGRWPSPISGLSAEAYRIRVPVAPPSPPGTAGSNIRDSRYATPPDPGPVTY